jgi:hypothetical protein
MTTRPKFQTKVHVVIPDTQVGPGVPTQHMNWIGHYIKDEYDGADLTVVHLGDHWTMDSLSSYDRKGGTLMEGRRYIKDIEAGNAAFNDLHASFQGVKCRRVFLMGNHEQRIVRATDNDATLDGIVTLGHLSVHAAGWEVHDFLEPVTIDGVTYAHYFVNPGTGRPLAGANLETRLKTVGHSFTMGHQQGLKWGRIDTIRGAHIGLAAGSCYIHDEPYLTPQVTNYWRGILVCHNVRGGDYDLMQVSLDYLARRYEGKPLSAVKWRK